MCIVFLGKPNVMQFKFTFLQIKNDLKLYDIWFEFKTFIKYFYYSAFVA